MILWQLKVWKIQVIESNWFHFWKTLISFLQLTHNFHECSHACNPESLLPCSTTKTQFQKSATKFQKTSKFEQMGIRWDSKNQLISRKNWGKTVTQPGDTSVNGASAGVFSSGILIWIESAVLVVGSRGSFGLWNLAFINAWRWRWTRRRWSWWQPSSLHFLSLDLWEVF